MEHPMDRRRFMTWITTSGLTALVVPGALAAEEETIAAEAIARAESLSGLTFTSEERDLMQESVKEHLDSYRKLRETPIPNSLPPALTFSPLLPGRTVDSTTRPVAPSRIDSTKIEVDAPDLAFQPVTVLGDLLVFASWFDDRDFTVLRRKVDVFTDKNRRCGIVASDSLFP